MAVCDYIPSSVFYPTPPRPLPSHVTKGVCRLPDPINAHLGARIRPRRCRSRRQNDDCVPARACGESQEAGWPARRLRSR